MAIVHSYSRYSSAGQALGTSEARQVAKGLEWIKRNGHTLSDLSPNLIDKGKSGWSKNNRQAALAAFLKELGGRVKAGDILLIEAIDRLSRRGVRETQDLVNTIFKAGVDICILSPVEKIYHAADSNDLGGAIELASFAFGARVYSDRLSDNMRGFYDFARGQARNGAKQITKKKLQNGFISGVLPSWLDKQGEPIPERAETIRFILARIIAGMGLHRLNQELNDQGIKSFTKSKVWNYTYLLKIVRGRQILGEYQPKIHLDGKPQPAGEPIKGYFKAITNEDTWEAANAALDRRYIERGPTGDFVNIFTGLVFHAVDRCPAHVATGSNYAGGKRKVARRLISSLAHYRVLGASRETVELSMFERAVLRDLCEAKLPEHIKKTPDALVMANATLTTINKRLKELQDDLENGDEAVGAVRRAIGKKEAEKKEAEQRVRALSAESAVDAPEALATVNRISELPQTRENRQLMRESLKQCIERINLVPIKLGSTKAAKVYTFIEIVFRAGHRRYIILRGGRKPAMYQFTDCKPPALTLDARELKRFVRAFREAMADFEKTQVKPRAAVRKLPRIPDHIPNYFPAVLQGWRDMSRIVVHAL